LLVAPWSREFLHQGEQVAKRRGGNFGSRAWWWAVGAVGGGERDAKARVIAIGDRDERGAAGLARDGKHGEAPTKQGMGRFDYFDHIPAVLVEVVEGGINL
jgi:hypothetical protein